MDSAIRVWEIRVDFLNRMHPLPQSAPQQLTGQVHLLVSPTRLT
jgi:hypothetical protein